MNTSFRRVLVLVALFAVVALLALQFRSLLADPTILPPDDFVEYWAAGRLNAHGENPYDPDKLLPLERSIGRDTDEAIMMWNPPWTLAIAMPFGLMDGRAAQLLWLLLGFLFVGIGADWLWRIYDGPPEKRWVAWLLAFTFLPTFFVLGAGQIGTWVLLGAVLFLGCLRKEPPTLPSPRSGGRDIPPVTSRENVSYPPPASGGGQGGGLPYLAGASTVLLAIKPHLVYLFWIALVVWGIRRDRRVLVGGLIAGLLATGVALVCNPRVLHQHFEAMTQRPPAQWKSPTLGSLLRMIEGESRFGLQFIPALLGIGWLIWHAWRTRNREWKWHEQMPMLLLVSFVTASYGAWPFDLIILLPAVIALAADITRKPSRQRVILGVGIWLAINLSALVLNVLKIHSFWFIWMAPAMLVAYLTLPESAKMRD